MPLLPFISDTEDEMEKIVAQVKQSGADYIVMGGLTLFGTAAPDSKTLFYKFIERYDPSLLPRYHQLYGNNFYTSFAYQNELKRKAETICARYKLRTRIIE
jgi:DNA repair photolyase